MQSIHATFQEGVFRPLGPIALPEGSEVELHVVSTVVQQPNGSTTEVVSIEDRLSQLAAQVPQQDWDALPEDLSDNVDLHLYGTNRE